MVHGHYLNLVALVWYANWIIKCCGYVHPSSAQCPELKDPANGMVNTTSRRLSGSTATYTCNTGFELLNLTSGSDVRTCQPDGMWLGSEAQCIGKLLVSSNIDSSIPTLLC